ncbi:ribonuclease H-like domain-containing protein [Haematococcus lacustris]
MPSEPVALDCEMVGLGPRGCRSAVARVAVVDQHGEVLLDRWVRPEEPVTDYRTTWSGVRAADLRGAGVLGTEAARNQVAQLLQGRLLVGHALHFDLGALRLSHPPRSTRDTSKYQPLMQYSHTGCLKPRSLRKLAASELGLHIQEGEHSPVEDARAAMKLYLRHRAAWERSV